MDVFYTCPICNQEIERELVTFLKHADIHIIEAIKKAHPDWTCEGGLCPKCLEYYRKAKGGREFSR